MAPQHHYAIVFTIQYTRLFLAIQQEVSRVPFIPMGNQGKLPQCLDTSRVMLAKKHWLLVHCTSSQLFTASHVSVRPCFPTEWFSFMNNTVLASEKWTKSWLQSFTSSRQDFYLKGYMSQVMFGELWILMQHIETFQIVLNPFKVINM